MVVNDTSIVLKLGANDEAVLLAGDMQFAKAAVDGLDSHMNALLQAVNDKGPYDLLKSLLRIWQMSWQSTPKNEKTELLTTRVKQFRLFASAAPNCPAEDNFEESQTRPTPASSRRPGRQRAARYHGPRQTGLTASEPG